MKKRYLCEPATTEAALEAVCRLRYVAYRSSDHPEWVGEGPVVKDAYDGQPHCTSLMLRREGSRELLGSIRPCVYDPKHPNRLIPAFDLFGPELRQHFSLEQPIVQSTHFVLSPAIWSLDLLPKLTLFREVFRTAVSSEAAHVVTVIRSRPSHVAFFADIGFEPKGEPRWAASFSNEVVLVATTVPRFVEWVRRKKIYAPLLEPPLQNLA